MAMFVFFGIPAHGHTNPTLALVSELTRQGQAVAYFSTLEFKDKIIQSGASFHGYPQDSDVLATGNGNKISELYYTLVSSTQKIISQLIEELAIIKPDCIIHDSLALWGRYLAQILNIPAITSVTTFALNKQCANLGIMLAFLFTAKFSGLMRIFQARKILRQLEQDHGVPSSFFLDVMTNEEALNIVYGSRDFQPNAEFFAEANYQFIGPIITERKNDPDRTDYSSFKHPIIYVSMGTIWKNNYTIDVFIDALADLDGTLVFSGSKTAKNSALLGPNVILKDHVNQLEILKHCDVFICHGGMNSVNESIYHGVPMCIYPFQMEQAAVAYHVVARRCGLQIKKLKASTVKQAVSELLSNDTYRHNCAHVAQSFTKAGGPAKGVAAILDYVKKATATSV